MSTLRNRFAPFDAALASAFEQNIASALAEDIGAGDWTAQLLGAAAVVRARLTVREAAVLCVRPGLKG